MDLKQHIEMASWQELAKQGETGLTLEKKSLLEALVHADVPLDELLRKTSWILASCDRSLYEYRSWDQLSSFPVVRYDESNLWQVQLAVKIARRLTQSALAKGIDVSFLDLSIVEWAGLLLPPVSQNALEGVDRTRLQAVSSTTTVKKTTEVASGDGMLILHKETPSPWCPLLEVPGEHMFNILTAPTYSGFAKAILDSPAFKSQCPDDETILILTLVFEFFEAKEQSHWSQSVVGLFNTLPERFPTFPTTWGTSSSTPSLEALQGTGLPRW